MRLFLRQLMQALCVLEILFVSEAIIGVVVGGLLTGSGTWIAMWIQHKKWKTEQQIRILESKRNRLEELSKNFPMQ